MRTQTTKKPLRRKIRAPVAQNEEPAVSTQEPVHGQPVSPCDDLQARIAKVWLMRFMWSGDANRAMRSVIGWKLSEKSSA